MRLIVILCLLTLPGHAKAAALDLSDPSAFAFRTRLRAAFREPANFNEIYRVTTWGCGTACASGAIINLQSGSVFMLPSVCCSPNLASENFEPIRYGLNSDIIHLEGQVGSSDTNSDQAFRLEAGSLIPIPEHDKPKRIAADEPSPENTPLLGVADIPLIHETYEKNQARFFRNYGGKTFEAKLPLHEVARNLINESEYTVSFGGGYSGDVSCSVSDKKTLDFIVNKDKGDLLHVKGEIKDHTFGVIQLDDCMISD